MSVAFPSDYDDGTKWRIEHAARISLPVFQAVAGVFFALAILAVSGRVAVRLVLRRRLLFDDYVLLFGAACLVGSTGVLFQYSWIIYVVNLLRFGGDFVPSATDMEGVAQGQAFFLALTMTIWTTIYGVKVCFLISFKSLIAQAGRLIHVWYWAAVALTFVCWGIAITMPFVVCPYFGSQAMQHCSPGPPDEITFGLMLLSCLSDIITDLMIIAIPIYLLKLVNLKLTQKIGIGVFLCLSSVMIFVAIIRIPLARYHGTWDYAWQYLCNYFESCIAIIMASSTALRVVFVHHRRQEELLERARAWRPEFSPMSPPRAHPAAAGGDGFPDDLETFSTFDHTPKGYKPNFF